MKFLKSLNITGSIYIPMSLRWTSRVSSIDDRGIINHFDIQDSVFNIRYSLFKVFHIPQSKIPNTKIPLIPILLLLYPTPQLSI